MKNFVFILLLALLSAGGMVAQNRNIARKHFLAGEYMEAKPMFEKLYQRNPKNSEYSFWYSACCYETGDTVVSDSAMWAMMEFAASRKIVNAYRYLGDMSADKFMYADAIEWYNDFLDNSTDENLLLLYNEKLKKVERLNRMVHSTEKICVVDSFVVDKDKFLSAYKMGSDVGRISSVITFFGRKEGGDGYLSETERGTDIYYSMFEPSDSLMKLYHSCKVGDEWSEPVGFEGFDTGGNDNYPYMLADGTTIYFASDGEGSIGGYDIFITRYDSETGRYLRPDNIGMPFNSEANDYMFAVNEMTNLGWFTTDRRQPEGKVCVYVFVPNPSKELYNAKAMPYEALLALSQLQSVAATHHDPDLLRKARQQLAMLMYDDNAGSKGHDFQFVLDNVKVYTSLNDFKSKEARLLFTKWQTAKSEREKEIEKLERLRNDYATAVGGRKSALSGEILKLEEKVDASFYSLQNMEYEVRRLEVEKLFK